MIKKLRNIGKKSKGITLIALVITIIVLLILAGVSIAMLTGQNGILTQARKAKNETEQAQQNEAAILDEYNKYLNNAVGGGTAEGGVTIPEGLEIGSEVSYSPEGSYNWDADYYYSGSSTYNDVELNTSDANYRITSWKVLDIDKENGEVKLVPTEPTAGRVTLGGAQGYNNAVKLLNDACSNLYGNESKGITARSINIEDIEHYMTDEALEEAHSYEVKYGEQVSSAYTSNKYYPLIYAQEEKSVIDGTEKTEGLKMSEQSEFINDTENTGSARGRTQAGTSIQPYQTYWHKDMKTAFKDFSEVGSSAEGNFYNLIIPKGTSTTYWVASRCVVTYSSHCRFNVRDVYGGGVNASDMFYSDGNNYSISHALFPVVSLSSELIKGDTATGFSVN